jgi:hypothetical protein
MEKCEMYGGCWNPPAKEKPLSPSDATACSSYRDADGYDHDCVRCELMADIDCDTKELAADLRQYNLGGIFDAAADRLEELEEQLAAEREQITILRSDEKRLVGFAKTYRLRADLVEAKLEQERQDRKHTEVSDRHE